MQDSEIMRRIQQDDHEAFGMLYDRHSASAYGIARAICRDAGRASAATQEGFLEVWANRRDYAPRLGGVAAWVLATVRRRALADQDSGCADDDAAEKAGEQRLGLDGLPAEQRTIISLAFYGGLTPAEIAERLGLEPGAVKGRMRLGLHELAGGGEVRR